MIRRLPVPLTEAEIANLGRDLAEVRREFHQVREQKKEAMAAFKEQLDGLEARLDYMARSIRTGTAERQVECREQFDWDAGQVSVIRLDTGEVIETRQPTEAERQMRLEIEGTAAWAAAEADAPAVAPPVEIPA